VLRNDPGTDTVTAPRLRRQVVDYAAREAPGTIVIDTPNTYLYFVLGGGKAIRYGIGVGREGFTWSGVESISRMAEWPDWHPPAEMIARQPYLPRFMSGGPGNPLGARALYLGNSQYRIHGTNDPTTIGHQVSSGSPGWPAAAARRAGPSRCPDRGWRPAPAGRTRPGHAPPPRSRPATAPAT